MKKRKRKRRSWIQTQPYSILHVTLTIKQRNMYYTYWCSLLTCLPIWVQAWRALLFVGATAVSPFFFWGKRIDAFHNHNHMWYYFEFFMYRIHTHELHFIVGPRDSYDRFCITPICLACQWYINLTLLLVSMLDDVTSQSGGPSQSGVLYVTNMDFEMVNATVNFLKVLIRML